MPHILVCIKQVPTVSELPWDAQTGTLRRSLADGMMNPACRHALELALQIKETHGATITCITMGPPMAEEILREAVAVGADQGVLLTDRCMAGADTGATAFTLAQAIRKVRPDYDLILCGVATSDSETAQVGPQLAEELDLPCIAYADQVELCGKTLHIQRLCDNFMETLEMDLPGVITLTTESRKPRYVSLAHLCEAFAVDRISILDADALALDRDKIGQRGSLTKILRVYSPTAMKKSLLLTGAPKDIVEQILATFADRIGGAIGKDLQGES